MMDADYESTSGELVFMPGESIKDVYVNIFEDDITESDEEFYVDLLPVDGCDVQLLRSTVRNQTNVACRSSLFPCCRCSEQPFPAVDALQANVVITDSTSAGKMMFTESSIEVPHLSKYVLVPVTRRMGCEGDVSVSYETVDGTAISGMFLAQL